MPLPKPGPTEDQDAFMARCMRDSDLPMANGQRAAACMQAWRDRKKDEGASTGTDALDFLRRR